MLAAQSYLILYDPIDYRPMGFPGGSDGKASACSVGDLYSIPGLGRSPGEGKGYPLQYYGLENSVDCIARGVAKSRTRPSNFTCTWVNNKIPLYPVIDNKGKV